MVLECYNRFAAETTKLQNGKAHAIPKLQRPRHSEVVESGCAVHGGVGEACEDGTMRQLLLVVGLAAVVVGCASDALVPREQTVAIKNRDLALAPHSEAIQDTIRQSGNMGALAFLDAGDGHLVVLPGNTPAEAWAQHVAPPSDSPTGSVSVPPVVTFVHRADVPKAPESVTYSFLQQQENLRTTLAALDTELRTLSDSVVAIRQETRTSIATAGDDTQKALDSLVEDLAAARKFMLQTAELGRLDHEMNAENAKGIQRVAAASLAASQEVSRNSATLADNMRRLSESLASQLEELTARLDAIQSRITNVQ